MKQFIEFYCAENIKKEKRLMLSPKTQMDSYINFYIRWRRELHNKQLQNYSILITTQDIYESTLKKP